MVTCTTIKIKTVDQRLTVVQQPILSSGDVGTVRVEYELDSYWEGFTPSGTFYTNKKPDDVYEQLLEDGACEIPWEVLQEDGVLFIGLRGVDGAGLVKTAAPVRYRVENGSPRGSAAALEPTPNLYDRILKHLDGPCAGGSGSGIHIGEDEPTDGSEVWIDTDEEEASGGGGIHYVVGDSAEAGVWTGTCEDITEYYDGLTVLYKLNVVGATTTTLNINGLGAVEVKRNATTAISTSYPVGTVVMLTYSGGLWLTADYDVNTKNTAGSSNKASTKMFLVGATSQTSSGTTTYSNKNVYIGADNELYSNGKMVAKAEDVPNVTASVGQTIVVKEVDGNGKPTKWEAAEYQEKICGESIVPIVSDISVEIDEEGFGAFEPTFDIVVGRQYVVTINGTDYVETAVEQDGMGIVLDTVNMVGVLPNDDDSMALFAPSYPSQTVTISVVEHNITKIPETYLPQTVKRYVITLTDEDVADGLVVFVKSCTYDSFIDILYGGGEVIIKKTSQLSGAYGGDYYFKPVNWNFTQIEQSDGSVQNILGMTIADYVKVFGASSEKISLLFFGSGIPLGV